MIVLPAGAAATDVTLCPSKFHRVQFVAARSLTVPMVFTTASSAALRVKYVCTDVCWIYKFCTSFLCNAVGLHLSSFVLLISVFHNLVQQCTTFLFNIIFGLLYICRNILLLVNCCL